MSKLLRKAAYGPGNWFRTEDAQHLKSAYGFPGEFKDFRKMAAAAMLRTAWKENACEGGLAHKERSEQLKAAYRGTIFFNRSRQWADWYDRAAVQQMVAAAEQARRVHGFSRQSIVQTIAGATPHPWEQKVHAKVDKNMQKQIYMELLKAEPYDAEGRVRFNLARFGINDRRQAARALTRLKEVGKQVPPRVWAATFGVLWNRWATARRRQLYHSKCLLGCAMGEDSLEHYGRCPQVHRFARARLGLGCRFAPPWEYWLLAATEDPDTQRGKWWERMAWLHYAVLRPTNAARQCGGLGSEDAARALWQAVLEGARGSSMLSWLPQQTPATEAGGEVGLAARTTAPRTPATCTTTTSTSATTLTAAEAREGVALSSLDRFKFYCQLFMYT